LGLKDIVDNFFELHFEEPDLNSGFEFLFLSKGNEICLGFIPFGLRVLFILTKEIVIFLSWPIFEEGLEIIS